MSTQIHGPKRIAQSKRHRSPAELGGLVEQTEQFLHLLDLRERALAVRRRRRREALAAVLRSAGRRRHSA